MATTWAQAKGSTVAVGTATTGTEAGPPAAGDGLALHGLHGFAVHVEAGGAMTAGGTLQAWLKNPASGQWNRAPDLDLTVQALNAQALPGFAVPGPAGRIAYLPSGVGLACAVTIVGA